MRASLVALVVLALFFSGCAGGQAAGPVLDAGYSALAPQVTREHGAIAGLVLDEKKVGIYGVEVDLGPFGQRTRSDFEGRFTFSFLEPGPYNVTAKMPGYRARVTTVEVRPAEAAALKILLEADRTNEPQIIVVQNQVNMLACAADVLLFCGVSPLCQGCQWSVPVRDDPSYLVFEATALQTVPHPLQGPSMQSWAAKVGGAGGSLWACRNYLGAPPTQCMLPMKFRITDEQMDDATAIRVTQSCESSWVCSGDRYANYASFFYHTPESQVPENYSAVKKP